MLLTYRSRVNQAALTPWYLLGNVNKANCLAAFKPKGAASLAASYVNLVTPGTNDAAPGVAPTFASATGWTFNGTTQYLVVGSGALVTAAPLSMICLFNPNDITTGYSLLDIHDTVAHNRFILNAQGNVAGDPIYYYSVQSAVATFVASITGYTASAWHVACGVTLAINNRAAYLNGSGKGVGTTSNTPSGLDSTFIAVSHNGASITGYFAGKIGACAYYNIGLSDAQNLVISNAMLLL